MPGRAWLQAHIDDVKYMGKPLVLEEFGKAVGELPSPRQSYVVHRHCIWTCWAWFWRDLCEVLSADYMLGKASK